MSPDQYTSVEQLVLDESFQAWILEEDAIAREFWEEWLIQYPEKQHLLKEAKGLLLSLQVVKKEQLSDEEIDSAVQTIQSVAFRKGPGTVPVYPIHRKANRIHWLSVAASIALLFIVTFLVYRKYKNDQAFSEGTSPVTMIEKYNPRGRKATFILYDGTKVKLNGDSRLWFPNKFSPEERVVKLQGEAFFQVAKDSQRPFRILTGDVVTTVVGTSFNINAYEEEEEIQVAVLEGSVLVNSRGNQRDSVLLKPHEIANYNKVQAEITKHTGFDYESVFSWKDDVMYFKEASLSDIKDQLERWYGIEVEIQGKDDFTALYTGKFSNERLEIVMQAIAEVTHLHYKIQNEKVIIY
ncbi:FecR domain-containing protein [Rapidithrix thailandica]|uniref:FecR domain-containing protein n=1 Tax=Rapidithrix thailandica TaxID=413964 RepID=A0AAW9RU78_9BACT